MSADLTGGEADGASAVIQHVVSGGPTGTVVYVTRLEGGRMSDAALGDAEDADLHFTMAYHDAVLVARGEVSLGAAYMQGRLKVEGDMVKLFDLLRWSQRPECQEFVATVAGQTEL